jgi:hypothetical protein
MFDLPTLPLVLFVEPGPMVLRCYVGSDAVLYAMTVTGREVPLRSTEPIP